MLLLRSVSFVLTRGRTSFERTKHRKDEIVTTSPRTIKTKGRRNSTGVGYARTRNMFSQWKKSSKAASIWKSVLAAIHTWNNWWLWKKWSNSPGRVRCGKCDTKKTALSRNQTICLTCNSMLRAQSTSIAKHK